MYIMTNRRRGVLYVGVTSKLAERVAQHKAGVGSDFCARYRLVRLVHAEAFGDIREAIAREKVLKRWRRDWKIALVEAGNPEWAEILPW